MGGIGIVFKYSVTAALLLSSFGPISAFAQTGEPETKNPENKTKKSSLDTILVTAQKRTESQQDIPLSVTALSDDFLTRNRVHSLEDLAASVPGFVTTNNVNYSAAPLSIRGIGGANGGGNFFADEPVAVYIDEVYVGRLSLSTAALLDIDSIEVLRGPQGTLYGRNSTAGTVLINSARPTKNFEAYLRGSVARFNEYRLQGAVSGPISPGTLSGRLALGYADKQGYGVNSFDGSRVGGGQDYLARASLHFTLGDRVSLDLIGDFSDQSYNAATIAVADVSNPSSASPFILRPDFDEVLDSRTFALNDPNFFKGKHRGVTLKAEWALNDITVHSVTAYRSYKFDGAQDSDGTAQPLFSNNGNGNNTQFSQEIRLSSSGEQKLSWIVGVLYFREDNNFLFRIRNVRGFFGLGTEAVFRASQKLDALAVFAEAKWRLNDIFAVTVGARYSRETKYFTNQLNVDILNGGTVPALSPVLPGQTLPAGAAFLPLSGFVDSGDFDDFSPRVILEANVTGDVLLYASYSQGFTSGGFNVFALAPPFESQHVDAYEAGLKSEFWGRRARINASVFTYDYSNLQVRLPVPSGGVNIANAAEARITGAELEMALMPIAGLNLTANVSLLDAKFTRGKIPAVPEDVFFSYGAPIPLIPENIAGNSLSRAPDLQFHLAAVYTHSLGNSDLLELAASYRHQSKLFFLETNQTRQSFSGRAFSEVDIRFAYTFLPADFEIAVFGENIFNNRHVSQVTALGAFPNAALNQPARWGIVATKRF